MRDKRDPKADHLLRVMVSGKHIADASWAGDDVDVSLSDGRLHFTCKHCEGTQLLGPVGPNRYAAKCCHKSTLVVCEVVEG